MLFRIIYSFLFINNINITVFAKPIINSKIENNIYHIQNTWSLYQEQEAQLTKDESEDFSFKFRLRPTLKEICVFCQITLPIIRNLIEKNKTEYIHDIATFICVELKIEDNVVCSMAIKSYQVTLFYGM
jgi:hypothetical protein